MLRRLLRAACLLSLSVWWHSTPLAAQSTDLLRADPSRLIPINVTATRVQYRGREAVKVVARGEPATPNTAFETLAIIRGSDFSDGTIEADIAGIPNATADTSARGFVGIAFRVDSTGDRYAAFYLRPTNGRAQDQLRRNHTTQYISHPDYPWFRLRREQPGVYESYVDLDPGAWTSIRIEVRQGKARLFVNGSSQPVLIVDDMKSPLASGRIALWIDKDTEAHFSRLRVTPSR
jgi:hypothetical protein